jgi:hypothetical protein
MCLCINAEIINILGFAWEIETAFGQLTLEVASESDPA